MDDIVSAGALRDRVAVVTGASSGIGEATAIRMAALGAEVALLARRSDRLEAAVERIAAAGGSAAAYPTDVTDRGEVLATAERIRAQLGAVDLVFANAGVQLISPITDLKTHDWDTQIDLNIQGVMNTVQAFLPALEAAGADGRPADLVLTSSIAATRVLPGFQVYSGTKAYLTQLAKLLRTELGPLGVRVSTVEPGMVDTELPDHVTDPDASKLMADLVESIDVLQSTDVAETVAFIASAPKHVNLTQVIILPTAQVL